MEHRGEDGLTQQLQAPARAVIDAATYAPRLIVRLLDDLHTLTRVNAGLIEEIPKLRRELEGLGDLGKGITQMSDDTQRASAELAALRERLELMETAMRDLQEPTESLARSLSPFTRRRGKRRSQANGDAESSGDDDVAARAADADVR